MTKRERVQLMLFIAVLVGTALAQVASMAHMVEAFRWANSQPMAFALAAVTVIMSAVFLALAVITADGPARRAILAGLALMGVLEWAGNFAVGGLLVQQWMPADVSALFGLSPGVAERLAAFLLAGFLPVLVFIAVYAMAESAKRLLEEPAPNPIAEQMLQAFEAEWAATQSPVATPRQNGAKTQ